MLFVFFFNTHTANTKPKLLFNLFFWFLFWFLPFVSLPLFQGSILLPPGSARLNVQTQRGVPFCLQRESSFQGLGCVLRNEISGESFFWQPVRHSWPQGDKNNSKSMDFGQNKKRKAWFRKFAGVCLYEPFVWAFGSYEALVVGFTSPCWKSNGWKRVDRLNPSFSCHIWLILCNLWSPHIGFQYTGKKLRLSQKGQGNCSHVGGGAASILCEIMVAKHYLSMVILFEHILGMRPTKKWKK